jgi:hypothetical protein
MLTIPDVLKHLLLVFEDGPAPEQRASASFIFSDPLVGVLAGKGDPSKESQVR